MLYFIAAIVVAVLLGLFCSALLLGVISLALLVNLVFWGLRAWDKGDDEVHYSLIWYGIWFVTAEIVCWIVHFIFY